MPELGGGAQTGRGGRGGGAVAGVWWGQDRGLGGQWCFTVRCLTKIKIGHVNNLRSIVLLLCP